MRPHRGDPAPLREAARAATRSRRYFSDVRHLYIHVPFCRRRCAYCDFSIAVRRVVPASEFAGAVGAELASRAPASGWSLDTLYLGGGTPSLLGADGVARLLDAVRRRARLEADAEVTLEANPEDVTAAAAAAWRAAGVTRLSVGAQSFDDRALAWMHRTHDAARTAAAVAAAREGGIANLSLDLIFALPEALERSWERDVERALGLAPEHISLYGLTIEPRTPLGRWRGDGRVVEAPEERYARDYLRAHRALRAAGFEHYEVSNFARPGRRARHNAAYWRRVPYVGAGPAAHSFDGSARRWNVAPYAEWARRVAGGRDPEEGREVLTGDDREAERIYLALRTDDGLVLDAAGLARTRPWVDAGWGTLARGRLRLTAEGWLRLDALATDLTLVSSNS